jgi:hypothetical protein
MDLVQVNFFFKFFYDEKDIWPIFEEYNFTSITVLIVMMAIKTTCVSPRTQETLRVSNNENVINLNTCFHESSCTWAEMAPNQQIKK